MIGMDDWSWRENEWGVGGDGEMMLVDRKSKIEERVFVGKIAAWHFALCPKP